ncbi:MAG TPA: DNA photolyase [Nitrospirae bacterium]|nr:spore photoproduct lyase [bacterium BMS3Abin09]HDK17599.1 DNA photolyase [Nitrospirota bacterium]HDO67632.1 DNA photolyase [Nitrospirota bacterium]HEW81806.1 DNA photolyase [Nitrospirota bacterium]
MKTLNFKEGKKEVAAVPKKGEAMGTCATYNEKYLCCCVNVLRSVHNCPFECTYCFLQNYLTDGTTKVVSDVGALMSEVRSKIEAEPRRLFRIGTWELGDSLALESKTGQAANLIREFSGLGNAVLEFKTKSDRVDPILGIDHKGRTVVSWSLNTEDVTNSEEHGTAPLERRLDAMRKVVKAGYLIGLHFDPMIIHENWEEGYRSLAERVFGTVSTERIAWISIGSLRFNPEMKKKIENNYPESRLTCAEMVIGDDAKMRYVKPVRVEMYRSLYRQIKKYISKENLVYLCMERWDVWDKVFGYHPDSTGHLDYLFARSLYERYGLGDQPVEENYLKIKHGERS